jgi:hypothetical protein
MKLTDTQLVLLSAAAQREDGGIELAPNLKGVAAQNLVRKLLNEGLIEEVRATGSLPVWRRKAESARPGDGSRTFGSVELPPLPRLPSGKAWANVTFATGAPRLPFASHHHGHR